jgi:hypothetical protein
VSAIRNASIRFLTGIDDLHQRKFAFDGRAHLRQVTDRMDRNKALELRLICSITIGVPDVTIEIREMLRLLSGLRKLSGSRCCSHDQKTGR